MRAGKGPNKIRPLARPLFIAAGSDFHRTIRADHTYGQAITIWKNPSEKARPNKKPAPPLRRTNVHQLIKSAAMAAQGIFIQDFLPIPGKNAPTLR